LVGQVTGVKTPQWMVDKLIRSGQAIHSPVVDITNFVNEPTRTASVTQPAINQ
jgi:phenylalanyl-tRNA synthetase beta subunit